LNPGLFDWWREATPNARRALIAASLGWMLDAMDVLLYALVLNESGRNSTSTTVSAAFCWRCHSLRPHSAGSSSAGSPIESAAPAP
jgi:hypothetical protein